MNIFIEYHVLELITNRFSKLTDYLAEIHSSGQFKTTLTSEAKPLHKTLEVAENWTKKKTHVKLSRLFADRTSYHEYVKKQILSMLLA